ncbi:hypothetical protein EI28_10575 [Methanoculleus sp. MH98A]|nr:hypothetical protein EI28_10575 [Methanoculleus sp. MH98A]
MELKMSLITHPAERSGTGRGGSGCYPVTACRPSHLMVLMLRTFRPSSFENASRFLELRSFEA